MSGHIQTPKPAVEPAETRPRRQHRNRRARVAGIMAAALVISWGGPAASAYWQTLGSTKGGARADSILGVAAPAAAASAGAATVSWAQSTTAAGRAVSGYTVARYSAATDGTKVAAGGTCAGTITTLTCSDAALPAGTWHYTVTPVLGPWVGPESTRSGGVAARDTTRPDAPAISAPVVVDKAHAANSEVTVTAEAGSTVTITVTDTPPAGTPQKSVPHTVTATGSAQTVSLNLTSLVDGTLNYTAVATDAAGNVSDPGTATSRKDATAPTATGVSLANGGSQFNADTGDKVTVTFSEPLLPSTICEGWQNVSGSQTTNGTLTITPVTGGNNTLTFGSTGPGCASARFGTVTINGSYSGGGVVTFSSVLAWNPGTSQLTVTLGSVTGGTPAQKTGNVVPTYTPPSGLTDVVGNQLVVPVGPVPGTNSRF